MSLNVKKSLKVVRIAELCGEEAMTTGNSRFTLFQYEEWRNETEANRKYETYFPTKIRLSAF
ncbi:MAG: hypothetical protein DMG38_07520 [Acidobacteria bacterium]|nr:MAG: hypothetical protein DMG38_07520 [Acidobacteriota bacterium]